MNIIRSTIPENSILKQAYKKYDYADSFQGLFRDTQHNMSSTEIARTFFASRPNWGRWLFKLRNKLVAPFGLKTSDRKEGVQKIPDSVPLEKGERIGLFKIFDKTHNEIILGEDDKHLDFRISLYVERSAGCAAESRLTISTIVIFNSWAGVFYFFFVGPFHRLIVLVMLRKMLRRLELKIEVA